MAIRLKRVYDPPAADDGLRVLVTYYWPRGVPRAAVDRWHRALGTPPALLKPWQQQALSPEAFRSTYLASIDTDEARQLIDELARLSQVGTVTLLTSYHDLSRSHLPFLKEVIEERSRALQQG